VGGGQDDTEAALAAFGLQADRPLAQAIEIWPEHEQAVGVFAAMLTQWRTAPMGGVVGLDYSALPAVLEMMSVPRADWHEVFEQVRIMETEAVRVLNK
jgi:hypothetical protein